MSDQLTLALGMAWDGVSPRSLTKGWKLRRFAHKGTGPPMENALQHVSSPLKEVLIQLTLFEEE